MKKYFVLLIAVILIQSCNNDHGKICVRNSVSSATLENVVWGNFMLANNLLPGESSIKLTLYNSDEKLPTTHRISFTMSANGSKVYLETEKLYSLQNGDDLLIIIDDSTKVINLAKK